MTKNISLTTPTPTPLSAYNRRGQLVFGVIGLASRQTNEGVGAVDSFDLPPAWILSFLDVYDFHVRFGQNRTKLQDRNEE